MAVFAASHRSARRLSAEERRYYREWCVIALISLAALTVFTVMSWGQSLGFVLYDQFHRWSPAMPGNEIVVIEIDDRTLEAKGSWPIARSVYTELLRKLADSGNQPKAIGFDIFFSQPQPQDQALAEQMRRHRVFLAKEQPRRSSMVSAESVQISPVLAEAAQGLVQVNLSFEKDGSLRGFRLVEEGVPQMALAMSGLSARSDAANGDYRRLHLVHPQVGFPSASMADVLAGQVPLELFKDKFVFIGSTAPSLGDHYPTLYSGLLDAGTPGVMLHANLLSNLLHEELVVPVHPGLQLGVALLCVGLALVALLVLSPLTELVVNLSIALSLVLLSFVVLVFAHRWFDPGLSMMAIVLLKPAWAWRRNEMILSFMGERAAILEKNQHHRKRVWAGLRLRHFTSDTLLQYSRMLDKAINMASDRLNFLQRLVAEVPVAMLVTDEQGRILLANSGMLQALPADLVKKGHYLQALFRFLDLPEQHLDLMASKDHVVTVQDSRHVSHHFILRMAQIHDAEDRLLWVMSLTDISEMRRFQAERDRTLQLLSHDMRTPVSSIIALSREGQEAQMQASVEEHIRLHAYTLLGMMDDFIFSIQAQAPHYKRGDVALDQLVDAAVSQVQDLAEVKAMRLIVDMEADPPFIQANERLFTRVLVNLLVNAVRYGKSHTDIRIDISSDPASQQHPMARCRISNVVSDAQETIQAETGKSFGLGLEFVKTVVQKHEGSHRLELPSKTGELAVAELSMPLHVLAH